MGIDGRVACPPESKACHGRVLRRGGQKTGIAAGAKVASVFVAGSPFQAPGIIGSTQSRRAPRMIRSFSPVELLRDGIKLLASGPPLIASTLSTGIPG